MDEKEQLLSNLEKIAARWRESPDLSNSYAEGVAYQEVREALREKHNIRVHIEGVDDPVNYQVIRHDPAE